MHRSIAMIDDVFHPAVAQHKEYAFLGAPTHDPAPAASAGPHRPRPASSTPSHSPPSTQPAFAMGQPDEGSPPKARALPHYALPNFSVVLPTYSNNESDVITQAFRIGNFCSISALPNSMKPGQVSRSRFQKILDNRQPKEAEQIFGAPYKPKAKTFSEFEYVPSPFNMADELAKEDRFSRPRRSGDHYV